MRSSVVFALALIGVFAGSVLAYGAAAGTGSASLDIDLKDVTVKQAIDTLFEGRGLKYYIQPGVKGRVVELRLKGITLNEGLSALADAAGFSFRMENGAYVITPGKASSKAAQTVASGPSETAQMENAPPSPPVPSMPAPAPVIVNNNISSPPPVSVEPIGCGGGFYGVGGTAYQSGWYGQTFNLGSGPYVFGMFPQPPPPRGWVSSDQERLLRFEWAVPRRPGYAAPYPYFYP